MVSRHLHIPFHMYCLTDDSSGIIEDITCLSITDTRWTKWWHKISLLSDKRIPEKTSVLFDLDVVLYNNITDMVMEVTSNLTIAEAYWVDPVRDFKGYNRNVSCDLNSSVMIWNPTQEVKRVYDYFDLNYKKLLETYKGIDKVFFYHEFEEFELSYIDSEKWLQSYHHTGFDETKGAMLIFNQGVKNHTIEDERVKRLWV